MLNYSQILWSLANCWMCVSPFVCFDLFLFLSHCFHDFHKILIRTLLLGLVSWPKNQETPQSLVCYMYIIYLFSLILLSTYFCVACQANRSRSLGASVYCVGVKDFNETQVCIAFPCFKQTQFRNWNLENTSHVEVLLVLSVAVQHDCICHFITARQDCRQQRSCFPSEWWVWGFAECDRFGKGFCAALLAMYKCMS